MHGWRRVKKKNQKYQKGVERSSGYEGRGLSAWAEASREEGTLVEWGREGEVVAERDWSEGVWASA